MKKLNNLKKKIIYKSKYRGCKELDIAIGSLVERKVNLFTQQQLILLDEILDLDEQFLYDIIIKKIEPITEIEKQKATQILSIFNHIEHDK